MSTRDNASTNVRDIKRIVHRYRWRFSLAFFSVALTVLAGSLFLPRTFQANAIFERRNDLVMTEIVGRGAPQSFDMLKRSLAEELRGLPAISKVVDDLDLAPLPDEDTPPAQRSAMRARRQALIQHIKTHLRVYFDISTNEVDRVRVVFSDQDPRRTAAVANQLVNNYIENTREEIDRMLSEAAGFFSEQADQVRKRITQLEEQRLRFEIENAELLPVDGSKVKDNLTILNDRIALLKRRHRAIEARVKRLEAERGQMAEDQPQSVVRGINPEYQHIEKRLTEYQDKLEQALVINKMTEKHPTVASLREKLSQIRAELKKTPKQIITQRVYATSDAMRSEFDLKLAEATAERDAVHEELLVAQTQVARLQAKSTQYLPVRSAHRKLTRAIEDAQQQAAFWEDNHRRVLMAMDAELGRQGISLKFIHPSGKIQRPISPDAMQVLFAAVGLGLVVGMGVVVWTDRGDQSLHSLDQANQALSVPVMGSIDEIIGTAQRRWRSLWQRLIQPAMMTAMVLILGAAVYLNQKWLGSADAPGLHWLIGQSSSAQSQVLQQQAIGQTETSTLATVEHP